MTKRANLSRLLHGEKPAWVPFSINFWQWFEHHHRNGTLPEELAGCADYLSAMKALGCDIFSRNLDAGGFHRHTALEPVVTTEDVPLGTRKTTEFHTRHGVLRAVEQEQKQLSTCHTEEYLVKDWEQDGPAFLDVLEQWECGLNEAAFEKTRAAVGDDGIINIPFNCTPLKYLHMNFGLEYTCFFAMDYPREAQELCDAYWAKCRPLLERLSAHPHVDSAILMDNVDTPFYPPSMAEIYWEPYVRDAAEIMRRNGKTLFVHACGKLAGLAPIFARTRVSGLEGISHPPLGDWTAPEAQGCHPDFIFVGGFSAHEQEALDDEEVRQFYDRYLGMSATDRFIFASSCQTSINTSWERIKLVRDICRAWGGKPASGPVEN
ncbi:MAG: hypothetical protein WC003_00545 [Terrimicrobiaceae bacterium]